MAERDLIDAVHELLYSALVAPELDEVAALQKADRLCHNLQSRLGGHRYYLPRPDKDPRNLAIAADLRAGYSQGAVAAVHGVSKTTANRVKKRIEQEEGGSFSNPEWDLK